MDFFRNRVLWRWWRTIAVMGGLLWSLLAGQQVLAQPPARLYLQTAGVAGQSVWVELVAADTAALYGLEVALAYDPAVVAVEDMQADRPGIQLEPGPLFSAGGASVLENRVEPATGTIVFAAVTRTPVAVASGGGVVARFRLTRLTGGPASLQIRYARLVNAELKAIPVEGQGIILPDLTAGRSAAKTAFSVPADESFLWQLAAGVIVLLAALAYGLWFITREAPPRPPQTTPPVEMPESDMPALPLDAAVRQVLAQADRHGHRP